MYKKLIYLVIGISAAILGILYYFSNKDSKEVKGEMFETEISDINMVQETKSKNICVYICGRVMNPGVYELKEDSRICDVILLAGGVLEDADIDAVNQAEKITDGQKIYIPYLGEQITEMTNGGLININTADISALTALPGIGESRAKDIVAYRNSVGNFSRIEDIMNVNGIKEAAFNKIKDYICV